MDIVKRFINYVKIDTQSNERSQTCPSTEKQKDLGNLLLKELKELQIPSFMDENGYVYGKINKTTEGKKAIGFIAHMDTSPDAPGANVNPRIIKHYDGSTIKLNKDLSMSPDTFESLRHVIGEDIIVTDGNTLLGADDKAGIAIIMDFAAKVMKSNIPHGDIYIGFTPDEEIGRGADLFDLEFFKADFAYTLDGSKVGGIEYENFNAASAAIKIIGQSIHPGSAKNKLINAMHLAMEFHSMLPPFQNPAFTEGREGFNHLSGMTGEVEVAYLNYILRNHDMKEFKRQQAFFYDVRDYLNHKYGYNCIEVTIKESYLNMYEVLKKDMTSVELAREATIKAGVDPFSDPIRGGTDGARLTYMGLPTPNLGTGGFNFHGRYEFASINQMKKAVNICLEIIK